MSADSYFYEFGGMKDSSQREHIEFTYLNSRIEIHVNAPSGAFILSDTLTLDANGDIKHFSTVDGGGNVETGDYVYDDNPCVFYDLKEDPFVYFPPKHNLVKKTTRLSIVGNQPVNTTTSTTYTYRSDGYPLTATSNLDNNGQKSSSFQTYFYNCK